MTNINGLIDEISRRKAPCLTWYSSEGERIELSGRVFANWVIKSANLLSEEFDIDEDSVVRIAMPPHWRTVVMAFAVWSVGAEVSFEADASRADLLVTEVPTKPDSAANGSIAGVEPLGSWPAALVISLPALVPPPAWLPSDATYYNAIVSGMADERVFEEASQPLLATPPREGGTSASAVSLLGWLSGIANAPGAAPGGRYLVACDHADRSSILAIECIMRGASVVLANLEPACLESIQSTERSTRLEQS